MGVFPNFDTGVQVPATLRKGDSTIRTTSGGFFMVVVSAAVGGVVLLSATRQSMELSRSTRVLLDETLYLIHGKGKQSRKM